MAPVSGTPPAEEVPADPGRRDDGLDRHRAEVRRGAATVALVVTAFALAGLVVTGFDGPTSARGEMLLGFELNPSQNAIHLGVGLTGLLAARSSSGTRAWAVGLAAASFALLVYGMNVERDPLALNEADNWLHLVLGFVGVWLTVAAGSVAAPRSGIRRRVPRSVRGDERRAV